MNFHYPKYLRSSPHFVGLSLTDLVLLVGTLIIALILNFTPFVTLVFLVLIIGGSKIIESRFTRKFFTFYFLKKDTLKWREGYFNLIDRGILV